MNTEASSYLDHIVQVLKKYNQTEAISPILKELYENEQKGSLCIPAKPEWEKILKGNSLPFVIEKINGINLLFFDRIFDLKKSLEENLKKQISLKSKIKLNVTEIRSHKEKLEQTYSDYLNLPFRLNEGQSRAIEQALLNNFQIISGGPGTGKTTVVAFLLRIMKELEILPDLDEIALVAPTGRAAQRLTESIQSNLKIMGSNSDFTNLFFGQTVHSLLKFRKNEGRFYYNKERSLPYRLILVDEVSMMDLNLMVSLFDAIQNIDLDGGAPFHLIFLGDPNQLPSVDKGEVLADFLNELPKIGNFISHLTDSNRHTENSQIYSLMKSIYPDGEIEYQPKSLPKSNSVSSFQAAIHHNDDVVWLEIPRRNTFISDRDLFLEQLWDHHFIPQMKFIHTWKIETQNQLKNFPIEIFLSELNKVRCLTIFRSGYFGIEGLQTQLRTLAKKYFKSNILTQNNNNIIQYRDLSNNLYYEGMPIIVTKNDRSRKLFNGDVGFICQIETELRAVFCINHTLFSFAIDTLPEHEPAYFMTVHKSQGSEYDMVLFYLPELIPENKSELLNRKIIYTAVTRAKKKVILACDNTSWDTGLKFNPKRLTGFQLDLD